MLSIVFEGKKLSTAANSRQIQRARKAEHLHTLRPHPQVGTLKADLLAKSLSDPSHKIENLDRFFKEIIAAAS